jgi:3-oxoacyl-[acyl-carrier-protein] synthase-1
MSAVFVRAVGMACPVGLRWASACAAIRGKITRVQELPYLDNAGEPLVGSYLKTLDPTWTAEARWLYFLAAALTDVGEQLGLRSLAEVPLVVALPRDPAGRVLGEDFVARELTARLGTPIDPRWLRVVTDGACGGYAAVVAARELVRGGRHPLCLAAAADSYISARALLGLADAGRLLAGDNADGVIPGEAAACLVLTARAEGSLAALRGLGLAVEPSSADNDVPMRADGLVAAARLALAEAGLAFHELDFLLSDAAGESLHFRESALLVSRLLRRYKAELPVRLVARSLGDTGAAAGLCGVASALAAFARGYAPGPRVLGCAGNAGGRRAALVLESRVVR